MNKFIIIQIKISNICIKFTKNLNSLIQLNKRKQHFI